MKKVTFNKNSTVLSLFSTPILIFIFIFLFVGLLALPSVFGMISSDGSYKSPTSDGSYKAPTVDKSYTSPKSDKSYTTPKSDNSYEKPVTGSGLEKVVSDNNFKKVISDNNFTTPVSGPGLIDLVVGSGYITPDSVNVSVRNDTDSTLIDVQPHNFSVGFNESKGGVNETIPVINQSVVNESSEEIKKDLPHGPIDTSLVGRWALYSEAIYFKDGGFKFAQTTNADLTLRRDGTWRYGKIQGTWEVLPIIDSDWEKWGIKNKFTQKLVLHNWNNGEADGPIELTSFGAKYLWAVYDAGPPEVKSPAQIWDKFSPAPAREGDETFSELNLIGRWSINSQGKSTSPILEIKEDKSWVFGTSKGTWSVAPIGEKDWDKWILPNSKATHKMMMVNWNKKDADGPIELSGGQVRDFEISYMVGDAAESKRERLQFIPLKEDKIFLTVQVKGKGVVSSKEKMIECGAKCSAEYSTDGRVELSAVAEEGWIFSKWSGGCEGDEDVCEVNADRAKTVSAEFIPGCKDNSACALDQACLKSKCSAVQCDCGSVREHSCQKYTCCADTDCSGGKSCDKSAHLCVEKSACREVIKMGDSSEKHDIVFVGDGISNYDTLEKLVLLIMDYPEKYNGVFSVTPFKENKDKFNVWMVNAADYKYDENGEPNHDDYQRFVQGCDMDTVVVITAKTFRPHAFFPTEGASGGAVFLSLGFLGTRGADYAFKNSGRLLLHELGHAIGGLADEYVEYDKGSINLDVVMNCAPDLATAKQKWGDLVGVEGVDYYTGVKDIPGTTYYKNPTMTVPELGYFPDGSDWADGGCSYDWTNIRPTIGSIMNSQFEMKYDYGPVNERELTKKLAVYK